MKALPNLCGKLTLFLGINTMAGNHGREGRDVTCSKGFKLGSAVYVACTQTT